MTDIKSMNLSELTAYLVDYGFEKFRAKQVLSWIKQDADSFDDMTNIPLKLRDFLKENAYLACADIERVQRSKLDVTSKYLFRLYDGEYVEGVLMSYHHGRSMCISSQVGCKMGCTFCATGKSGFSRSLTASEMIAQIRSAELDCGERVSNVVLMGMGERDTISEAGIERGFAEYRHASYHDIHLRYRTAHERFRRPRAAMRLIGLSPRAE